MNGNRCDPSRPDEAAQAAREEPDPHIEFIPLWRFVLGKRDSLLVLKALGGRLAGDLERAEAHALGDRLTELRAKESGHYQRALDHASAKAKAKEGK